MNAGLWPALMTADILSAEENIGAIGTFSRNTAAINNNVACFEETSFANDCILYSFVCLGMAFVFCFFFCI
jgi:hypothetical protein